MASGPAGTASPEILLEMQVLPSPAESEALGLDPSDLY